MTTNTNTIQISTTENASAPGIDAFAAGTVIRVAVTDNRVADVIEAGYTHVVMERSVDGGITYDVVSTVAPLPLSADKTTYVFIDRGGHTSYYYRTRYQARSGVIQGQCTDPSEAILGEGLAIRGLLTVSELKARYMFGVDLTNDKGEPLSDATFTHYILSAIRWLEHELDIPILPTAFCERQDYYKEDYEAFMLIRLDNYPVISVESVAAQYPSGQSIVEFPQEWYRLNKPEGHLQIVPTAGTLSEILVGQGGAFLPAIYNGMRSLPQLFEVNYTAGFEAGKVPRNIVDIIGMFAAMGPFNIFGDLIAGAGIASVSLSLDGLSQSIGTTSSATNAGYGARIIQYSKQIKDQIPRLRQYYKGIRMTCA